MDIVYHSSAEKNNYNNGIVCKQLFSNECVSEGIVYMSDEMCPNLNCNAILKLNFAVKQL
jgi:hypothetical protein